MKLRNKKTGEIVDTAQVGVMENVDGGRFMFHDAIYDSLSDLTEEWEDYEEPAGYWYIDFDGDILSCVEPFDDEIEEYRKSIGNCFETNVEAEKAVEKLKAWKRLKDNGFKIEGIRYRDKKNYIEWGINPNDIDGHFDADAFNDDLHLLFGSKE